MSSFSLSRWPPSRHTRREREEGGRRGKVKVGELWEAQRLGEEAGAETSSRAAARGRDDRLRLVNSWRRVTRHGLPPRRRGAGRFSGHWESWGTATTMDAVTLQQFERTPRALATAPALGDRGSVPAVDVPAGRRSQPGSACGLRLRASAPSGSQGARAGPPARAPGCRTASPRGAGRAPFIRASLAGMWVFPLFDHQQSRCCEHARQAFARV